MIAKDQAKLQTAIRLIQGGDTDKALALFKDLAQRLGTDAMAQYNYGNALRMAGRLGEATRQYRAAIRLDPAHLDATLNLALACCELGQLDQALDLARAVLTRHPAHPVAAMVLNLAVDMGGLDDKARDELTRMVALLESTPPMTGPDQGRRTYVRGIALELLGRKTEATAFLRQATAFPDVAGFALRRLLEIQDDLCQWTERDALVDRLLAQPSGPGTVLSPFGFLRFDRPETALSIARSKAPKPQGPLSRTGRPRQGARLRIGYLSPDFRAHATATLMAEVVELHDRAGFDIQLFSCGPDDGSDLRRRLVDAADGFHQVHGLAARDLAHKIHAAHVDILVDLSAFILLGRLDVLAWRPAPIQVAWLGYPGTTGAPYVDYMIADPVTIPDDMTGCYSEALVRLPVTYQANDRRRAQAPVKSRAEYGLPENARVLAAFHQAWKINPALFDVWCGLMKRHPDTVLWFAALPAETADNLRHQAQARGIDPARLVFGAKLPAAEHWARYRVADLLLDSFPCGGHTTVSDALWQGCPTVTLPGRGFHTRVGASLLHAAGLDELIASDLDDYVAKLDHLLTDPAALPSWRARLTQGRDTCALFDTPRFVAELESAYRTMAATARAGQPPQGFTPPMGG